MIRTVAIVLVAAACGGATTPSHSAKPTTPIGGWTSKTGPLGPMILCVVEHGWGLTKMKGDRQKRAAKAAVQFRLDASGQVSDTWFCPLDLSRANRAKSVTKA